MPESITINTYINKGLTDHEIPVESYEMFQQELASLINTVSLEPEDQEYWLELLGYIFKFTAKTQQGLADEYDLSKPIVLSDLNLLHTWLAVQHYVYNEDERIVGSEVIEVTNAKMAERIHKKAEQFRKRKYLEMLIEIFKNKSISGYSLPEPIILNITPRFNLITARGNNEETEFTYNQKEFLVLFLGIIVDKAASSPELLSTLIEICTNLLAVNYTPEEIMNMDPRTVPLHILLHLQKKGLIGYNLPGESDQNQEG